MNIITEYTVRELLARRRAEAHEQRVGARVIQHKAAKRSPRVRLRAVMGTTVPRKRHLIDAYWDARSEWRGSCDAMLWDAVTADGQAR